MKTVLVLGVIALVIVVIVLALGKAMEHPGYPQLDLGFKGPLEIGAVSKSLQAFRIWPWPRGTTSRKEREEMCRGTVGAGEVFEVLNHFKHGHEAWILVRKRDQPDIEGWALSPATDPIRGEKLN